MRWGPTWGLALLLSLGPLVGHAHAHAGDAFIRTHARLERELARPASRRHTRRLARLLDRTLDYERMVHRVLVVHWDGLSTPQRRTVTELMTRAIRHRYQGSVGALDGWEVRVVSEHERGIGRRVQTQGTRGSETRSVSYDMFGSGNDWRVVDIIVEGDSLVHQYRVQFDRLINRDGWDAFIVRLRERVEEDGRGAT